MRWQDFSGLEKTLIVVLGLWFTLGWFVAGLFPNPILFINAPYFVIVIGTAIIWLVLTVTAWLLRRLGH